MKNKKMARILQILPLTLLALAAQPLWAQNAFVQNPSFEFNCQTNYPFYYSCVATAVPCTPISADFWTGGSGVLQTPALAEAAGNSSGQAGAWGTLVTEPIPDRDRVGYQQGGGTVSQEITNLVAGEQYWLQFWYEGRNSAGTMTMAVTMGGATIGDFGSIQLDTSGYLFANLAFTATNDTETLAFQTSTSGDMTVGLDAVNIVQRNTNEVVLMNPSFEASGPPSTTFAIPPGPDDGEVIGPPANMAGWTWDTNFTGVYGVSTTGGTYADNGAIPDQAVVGFISGPGSLSQTVPNLFSGTPYQLTFSYNAQKAAGTNAGLQVLVGGAVVDAESVAPVGGSSPYHSKTVTFTPSSSTVTISFVQTNANAALLLDDIHLTGKVPTAAPVTFSPLTLDMTVGQTVPIQVTLPATYLASSSASISVSSANPAALQIVGATNGTLTLTFTNGGANVQTFEVLGVGLTDTALTATTTNLGLQLIQLPTATIFGFYVLNPSFEDSAPGVTPISAWTGGTAVQSATGPDLDNGIIPDRTQVAVVQGANSLSQRIYNLVPGTNYWLQFWYNASYGDSQAGSYGIDLKVKLGGNLLATMTNVGPAGMYVGDVPFYFTNINFVPTNTSELLEFDTTPSVAGTTPALLLDGVSIVQRDTNEMVIMNPCFVTSGETAYPTYVTGPLAGWAIAGANYGCDRDTVGPFADTGLAPGEGETMFMQGTGTASNTVTTLTVGKVYTLSYAVNDRNCCNGTTMAYDAGFGDITLASAQSIAPVGDDNPYVRMYFVFTNDASTNVLGFASHPVNSTGGTVDGSLLLTDIHIVPGARIPPQLVSESPAPGESSLSQPPLQFVLTQGSYPFDTTNIQLLLNGTNVAASATVTLTNNGIIISYAYPKLPPGTNTVELIVNDKNNPPMTINTTYTFVTLPPPVLVVSVGAMMDPTNGVDVGVGFNNTVDDAAGSLLSNYSISSGTITSLLWCTNRFTADSTNPLVMVRKQSAFLRVTGLSGGGGTLTIKNVTDTYGNNISSTNIAFTVAPNLTWGNVGASELGGWQAAVPVGPGDFDIYSDGFAEWGTYDETTFVYEQVTGDFDKKLRVEYQDGSSEWGRAGIVVRDVLNLGVDSAIQTGSGATAPPYDGKAGRYQKCHVNPVGATLTGPTTAGNASWEGNRRLDTGGASTSCLTNANAVPDYPNAWCRIQRKGQTFTIFRSADGVTWELLGQTVWGQDDQTKTPMPATVYVGPEFSPENGNITLAADQGTFLAQFRDYGDYGFNPQLTIGFSAGKVTVTWAAGTLVSSPTVNGTYTPVTGAASPYVVSPATGQAMFYRVME